jgi:hypothetical protein
VKSFEIDAATVAQPGEKLREILRQNAHEQQSVLRAEIAAFGARFQEEHGIELTFDEAAVDALVDQSLVHDKTIRALCEDKFHNLQHGLKLLIHEGEPARFAISREMVEDPDKTISRLVVERFREGKPAAG